MEELIAWFLFFLRVIVFVLIVGIPLILIIILLANFIYKRLNLDKKLKSKD
ncbi:hypothetical protein [Thermocrinis sp.]